MARQRSSGSRSYSKPSSTTTAARTSASATDGAPATGRSSSRSATGAKGGAATARRSGPRRDWSKIALYTFSIIIVLSMVLSLFAPFLQ